jgi:TolA-binding protein
LADAKEGGDGPSLSPQGARGTIASRPLPSQQQQLQQQVTQLQQQITQLTQAKDQQKEEVTREQPVLTSESIASAISTAVSTAVSAIKSPADEKISSQLVLTGAEDPESSTMADRVLNHAVKEARATAKVQPLLYLLTCFVYHTYHL